MCNRYRSASVVRIRDAWGWTYIESGPDLRLPSEGVDIGPLQRGTFVGPKGAIRIGQWGLTPDKSKTLRPLSAAGKPISTNNARWDAGKSKPEAWSFLGPWLRGQRCIVPAEAYDEPCYAARPDGKNTWWRFARQDGRPWALAGLWNEWTDPETGEVIPSYTMLTINCNAHPLLSLMHKPDLGPDKQPLPPEQQDKRTVVPLQDDQLDAWLHGTPAQASALIQLPALELYRHGPADPTSTARLPL